MAAPGDVILTSFNGLWHGQKVLSTFYWGINTVTGAPSNAAFIAALDAQLLSGGNLVLKFLPCAPPQYTLVERWHQFVAPLRTQKVIVTSGLAGTGATASTTANVANVITRRGDLANKHNVGSLHVPASNANVGYANGLIGAAQQALLQTLATQMLAPVVMAGVGSVLPILWFKPSILNATPITSTTVQQTIRVMRRRTVGVGK